MPDSEKRVCQNCKGEFVIDASDFKFYEKISVPPPTWCPDCRKQRRLAWRNDINLFSRKCDLCGKPIISIYSPESEMTVYCQKCWWSDKWNPMDYARNYDFSRPFFEQFNEQIHRVPLMGLAISKVVTELSPYTNHCDHDCSVVWECERCYDSMNGIFNKQYDQTSFHELREKIITKMKETNEWGEFFPMKLSPHDYNDTFSHLFFPLSKEEVEKRGLSWIDDLNRKYETTKDSGDLPDHIRDAKDDILNEIIKCQKCSRGFRVTELELSFLREHNFPLPRKCPFCRIEEKVKRWVWQMTLVERICDNCSKLFRTNYRKEDAERIYCKECYLKEVV